MNRNQKRVAAGVFFIALAVYLIVWRMGIIPDLPIIKILLTIAMIYVCIRGIANLDFGNIFVPIAIIGWMYDEALGIESLTPWILLISAVCISIGLEFLLKDFKVQYKRKKYLKAHPEAVNDFQTNMNYGNGKYRVGNFSKTTKDDGDYFTIENALSEGSSYVDSTNFKFARIDNGLGKCQVYFQGCKINTQAAIHIDNGVGSTEIYIPKEWRIQLEEDNAFGSVNIIGEHSMDSNAPFVYIKVENGVGTVNITCI